MAQIGFFDGTQKFKNNKPIRLIELFGGIKAQATALKELGVEFENYRYVDFDKYAVKSANAMYGTNFEQQDITKITASDLGVVDIDKFTYIMTYSFPCTDLSLAGKGLGMAKGSGTRSGLLWEVERLLLEMKDKPQVLLMENVPEVIGTKNMPHFAEWIKAIEKMGYKNYWQVLNATEFGIPQNRERCFMVSLLGDYYYEFPRETKLELRLRDMLENEVDEKYYLSDKMINYISSSNEKFTGRNGTTSLINKEIANTVTTREGNTGAETSNYVSDNLPNNIHTSNLKTQLCNKLIEENKVKEFDIIRHSYSNSRIENKREIAESNNISPTLDTRCDCLGVVEAQNAVIKYLRIRKLTPKECWRLMGFRDELFEKAQKVNSNAQLYKQAGNSIVVTVLMAIFGELLEINWQEKIKNLILEIKND